MPIPQELYFIQLYKLDVFQLINLSVTIIFQIGITIPKIERFRKWWFDAVIGDIVSLHKWQNEPQRRCRK